MQTLYNPRPRPLRVPLCQPPRGEVGPAFEASAASARLRSVVAERLGYEPADVVLTSSGRVALVAALRTLAGARPGRREVLVSSFNCPHVVQAIIDADLEPVLCDVAPGSSVSSIEQLAVARGDRTLAVVLTAVLGRSPRIDAIGKWCERHDLWLVDDAAQTFAGVPSTASCGTRGELGIISFGRHKPLCAGGGGALIINHRRWRAPASRSLRTLGSSASSPEDARPEFRDVAEAVEHPLGPITRTEPSDEEISAALDRFEHATEEFEGAWECAEELSQRIGPRHPLRPWPHEPTLPRLFFTVGVVPEQRHAIASALARAGVETTWLYYPLHRTQRFGGFAPRPCPHADALWPRLLMLPCRPWLSPAQRAHLQHAITALPRELSA